MRLRHTCGLQPGSLPASPPPGGTAHLPAALCTHSLSWGPGAGRSRRVRPAAPAGVWTHGVASRGIQGRHANSSEAGLALHRGRLMPVDKNITSHNHVKEEHHPCALFPVKPHPPPVLPTMRLWTRPRGTAACLCVTGPKPCFPASFRGWGLREAPGPSQREAKPAHSTG